MATLPTNKTAKLISKEYVNSNKSAELFTFQLPIPDELDFKPGQFISIKVLEKPVTYRAYSICSDPTSQNEFEIVATTDVPGVGVNYLKKLKVGSNISFIGPGGRFYLREAKVKNIIFVATGTGIAPFIPMLYELAENVNNEKINIQLYYGLRTIGDLFFYDQLLLLKSILPMLEYSVCFSKQPDIANYNLPNSYYGRVTNFINFQNNLDTQIYICGNPHMVEEVKTLSINANIPTDQIFFEKFNHAKSNIVSSS